MDKKWVRLVMDEEKERAIMAENEEKCLLDAVVLHREDKPLSDKAVETIRQMRYYTDARRGLVLLGEQECVTVDVNFPEDMVTDALREVDEMLGHLPDFHPLTMDDDHGLLCMGENFFGYREEGLAVYGGMLPSEALKVRGKCLDVCVEAVETGEVLAVVYPGNKHIDHFLAASRLL